MEMKVNHYVQDWNEYIRHVLMCGYGMVNVDISHSTNNRYGCKTLIWGLYVNEKERRKGIAKKLLAMAEDIARDNGQEIVCLECEKPTPQWVFDWYIRMGYEDREFGNGYAAMYKTLTIRKEEIHF